MVRNDPLSLYDMHIDDYNILRNRFHLKIQFNSIMQ